MHDGGTSPTAVANDAPAPPEPTYAPTYTAVWNEILFWDCALPFCHGGRADLFLVLTDKPTGYASLLGTEVGPLCADAGLRHVVPFNPDQSLLYRKVTDAPCGERMPITYGGSGQLDPRQIDQIKQWIELGAPDD